VECTNPLARADEALCFSSLEFETKKELGDFDLETGTFTVNKSGIFQFNFNGLVQLSKSSEIHHVELRVDGVRKANTFMNSPLSDGFQPAIITALLQLVIGQKVSINIVSGDLYDSPTSRATRFSCVCFA